MSSSDEIVYKYPCYGKDCPHGDELIHESALYRLSHPISLFTIINPHIREDKEGDMFMCRSCFDKVRIIYDTQCQACERWTGSSKVVRKYDHVICQMCIDRSFPYNWDEDSGKIYNALYRHNNGESTKEDADLIQQYFARIKRFYDLRRLFRSNRQLIDLYMKIHVMWIPTFCEEDIYKLIQSLSSHQRKLISNNNIPETLKTFLFRIMKELPQFGGEKPECEDDDA